MDALKIKDVFSINDAMSYTEALRHDIVGFEKLAGLLKQKTGINLVGNEKNLSLMAGRLSTIMRARGFGNYEEYFRYLKSGEGNLVEFIQCMTTNTTEFFREPKHFEVLTKVMPQILQRKNASGERELRIWCAAASTGQEPFTIAMQILEHFPQLMAWKIHFLATDIDEAVLRKAAASIYSETEVKGIPPLYRQKYLQEVGEKNKREYIFDSRIRNLIRFAPLNLVSNPYPFRHRFDIIFCRNVLIYFDGKTGADVVHNLLNSLQPGGYLFLGHSETGVVRSNDVTSIACAVYHKDGGRGGRK